MSYRRFEGVIENGAIYERTVKDFSEVLICLKPAHEHTWQFLRQKINTTYRGPERPSTATKVDVFYCINCLEYQEK